MRFEPVLVLGSLLVEGLLTPSMVLAAPPAVFIQTSAADFEEGEAAGTVVAPPGQVEPGFSHRRVDIDAAFVWASALSADGKTAFVTTGDPGRVYATSIAQASARLLAELPEPWVTAVAVQSPQTLLVATTPGAKLYQLNISNGQYKEIARLQSEHIWSLLHDNKTRTTYAATGSPGRIATIDAAGKVRKLWDSGDQHLVSLAFDADGALLAGSAEKAILFRVTPQGKATALTDFEAAEVRAVAVVGDVTYVAVNAFETPPDGTAPAQDKAAKGTPLVSGGKAPAAPGRLPRPGAPKARGAVYRLDKHGALESVANLDQGYFTALGADKAGNVFAAAGTEGKVFRIDPDRSVVLVAEVPERQALTVWPTATGLVVGTGDAGAVFVASPAVAKAASYLSKVFDANRWARWGQFRYGASAALAIETRSGNTARPDATWAGWTALGSPAFSQSEGEGRISSPPGRYVQYRVTLPQNAVLRDTAIYHRPQNLRTRISDLSLAPGEATDANKREHSAMLRLRWKVENADGDVISYKLAYKPEHENQWRTLVPGHESLAKPEYDWNTEAVPDGQYVVQIKATDAASVPQDQALESTYVSPPVLVDNTRPTITDLVARMPEVAGVAEDAASVISHVEVSIDAGPWHSAAAKDGLLDQKKEAFGFRLPKLSAGPHVVAVRVYDGANNVGAAQIVITAQ